MASLIGVQTCDKCAHSYLDGNNLVCRFNPPATTPIIVNTPAGPQVVGWAAGFPPVNDQMHCGQYKVRIEIAAAYG